MLKNIPLATRKLRTMPPIPNSITKYAGSIETLEPGMQAVVLDSEGKLLETRVPGGATVFDWSRLFAAAGLDATRFHAAPSKVTPIFAFDNRAAWTGSAQVVGARYRYKRVSRN
jgi:hypothetical protein